MSNFLERAEAEAIKRYPDSSPTQMVFEDGAQFGYTERSKELEAFGEEVEQYLLAKNAEDVGSSAEPSEGWLHRKYTPANQHEKWVDCRCHWGADHGAATKGE